MGKKSCGKCRHAQSQGYKNWGSCEAPAPRWVYEGDETPSNVVWFDGGWSDLAEDCEMYEERKDG